MNADKRKYDRPIIILIRLFGILFFLLGLLKIHGLLSPGDEAVAMAEYAKLPNAIFPFVTNRIVLYAAALTELIIGFNVMKARSITFPAYALLWFSANVFAYKIALTMVGYRGPCGCLLGIDRVLPISVSAQRSLSEGILLAAILVSIASIMYDKHQDR